MVYSARLRTAVGGVRLALAQAGIERQSPEFLRHGEHEPAADAPLVLVACSGGRDSMALAAVSHIVCASLGLRCGAVIVDHRLQSGSGLVADQTARRCRKLGLEPVLVRAVEVHDRGEGLEAAARAARYQALCDAAREWGAACVLLAHTMDDQAETVLIGLLRGHGIDMVAGMPPATVRQDVRFLRPLLDVTRADTTGICEDLSLDYWDDPTNGEQVDGPLPDGYPLRSRIRHDLMPVLRRLAGTDVARHLAANARLIRYDKEYLDRQSAAVGVQAVRVTPDPCASRDSTAPDAVALEPRAQQGAGATVIIDARLLAEEPPSIRLRVVAHALSEARIAASAAHIEAIDRLIVDWHGQSAVCLPSGYSANRKKHVIRVCQDRAHANR
ncbi:tRNA(Ile)-lysidine synthetase [Bifidobacterium sp. UTCIF-3]|uniref:tRNA lysidine(34) synthetase TilS n=1 Tax=unclassified Bifidobacterium TaxID=2608897 RepID=UPI00112DC3D0|nr:MULTISPECIES: tRNA lysidine(34) synthetase TilS [unclassified Bifidobacterium]TPF78825.1 tRNA(Ile)-lysidine synthetase [Bifidobacterium sp. UTCIF-1]TPF82586.1 tRNA(Ile)-lysidine synthetase [Bifidobacterium sp. UTCIF-3]TPF84727.1 tRNA(Ile)-lysidine synthetase [Bifidobacterium sp. UTCIF-36]